MASQLFKDLMEGLAEVAELEGKPELAKTIRYERDTFDESLTEAEDLTKGLEDDFYEMPIEEEEPVYNCPDCDDELTFIGYQGNTIEYKCPVCGKYFYDDNGDLLSSDEYDDKYYEAEDESLTEDALNEKVDHDLIMAMKKGGMTNIDFENNDFKEISREEALNYPSLLRDNIIVVTKDGKAQYFNKLIDANNPIAGRGRIRSDASKNRVLRDAVSFWVPKDLENGYHGWVINSGNGVYQREKKRGYKSDLDKDSPLHDIHRHDLSKEEKNKLFQTDARDRMKYDKDESLTEAKNETLNQAIWDENNELKPEVKETLTKIADTFLKKLEEDDIPLDVEDLEIVGSNANYTYTPQSDIDLHIIADLSQFKGREKELAEKIYQCKKSIFNDKYDPTIRGYEVEIYVEPSEDKNANEIPDEVEEPSEETLGNEEVVEEGLNENSINGIGYNDSSDPLGDYYDSLRTKHAPSAKFNKRSKEDQALCNKYQQEYRSSSNQWNVSDEDRERAWDMARNKYRYMFDTQLVFAKVMEETGDKNFAATVADMVDLLHED